MNPWRLRLCYLLLTGLVAAACTSAETSARESVEPVPSEQAGPEDTATPPVAEVVEADPPASPILEIPPRGAEDPSLEELVNLWPAALASDGSLGLFLDAIQEPDGILLEAAAACGDATEVTRLIGYDIAAADRGETALLETGLVVGGYVNAVVENSDQTWSVFAGCGETLIVELGPDHRVVATQSSDAPFDTASWPPVFTDPNGLRFSTTATPYVGKGGDWTVSVDRGSGFERAIDHPGSRNGGAIDGMWFGPDRSIAWTAHRDVWSSTSVARYDPDGHIVDVHSIDPITAATGAPLTARRATFLDDGRLLLLGYRLLHGSPPLWVPAHGYHDLSSDTMFVESLDPQPEIDRDAPLLTSFENLDAWYRGDTASDQPECGSQAVYADGPDGLYRPLGNVELPPVTQVLAGDPYTIQVFGVDHQPLDSWVRSVLLLVKCPGAESGRVILIQEGGFASTSDAAVADLLELRSSEEFGPSALVRTVGGFEVDLQLSVQLHEMGPLLGIPPTPPGVNGPVALAGAAPVGGAKQDLLQATIDLLTNNGLEVRPGNAQQGIDLVVFDSHLGTDLDLRISVGTATVSSAVRVESTAAGELVFTTDSRSYDNGAAQTGVSFACGAQRFFIHETYNGQGIGPPSDDRVEYYLRGLVETIRWICPELERPDPNRAPTPALAAAHSAMQLTLSAAGWDMATAGYDHPGPNSTVFVLGGSDPELQVGIFTDFELPIDAADVIAVYQPSPADGSQVTFSLSNDGDPIRALIDCGDRTAISLETLGQSPADFKELTWAAYYAVCIN